jgi:hypothetical protein
MTQKQCSYSTSDVAPCVVRDGPTCYEMRAVCVECRRTAEQIGIPAKNESGELPAVEQGMLRVSVTHDDTNIVRVHFGSRPIAWLGLKPDEAILMAKLLLQHAGAKKVVVEL